MTPHQNSSEADPQPQRVATKADFIVFFLFVVVWILPLTLWGARNKPVPLAGRFINYMSNASCLFTWAPEYWPVYYIQIQTKESWRWIDVPVSDFSRMQPVGYFTRLDWILQYSYNGGWRGWHQRQSLAEFIKQRFEERHVGTPEVYSVRFLVGGIPTGDELARQEGHWVKPPISTIPRERLTLLSSHYFDGRQPARRDQRQGTSGSDTAISGKE